jgi:hypothetical protein
MCRADLRVLVRAEADLRTTEVESLRLPPPAYPEGYPKGTMTMIVGHLRRISP